MKQWMPLFLIGLLISMGCSPDGPHQELLRESDPSEETTGEDPGDGARADQQEVVGYDAIEPIFAQYCSRCHPSRSAPDWSVYEEALDYVENGILERRVIVEKSMPQEGSPEAQQISESERQKIAAWIEAEGPRDSTSPPPPEQRQSESDSDFQGPAVAQQCLGCHGPDRRSNRRSKAIPFIVGQNLVYIENQLKNFRSFDRLDPDLEMNWVAKDLSDQEIAALAEYFSMEQPMETLPNPASPDQFPQELLAVGDSLAKESCNSCHKPDSSFKTVTPEIPKLAGQNFYYLRKQLRLFQENEFRQNETMASFARELSPKQIEAISAYYSRISDSD